jgi:NAD+ diphosphatase
MSAFDSFPLGQPGFISQVLDRAAHLRTDEAKLLALEAQPDARAYVVYRDSLVVKARSSWACAMARRYSAWAFRPQRSSSF